MISRGLALATCSSGATWGGLLSVGHAVVTKVVTNRPVQGGAEGAMLSGAA